MGLAARLNFAFLTVILIMVAAHAGAQYFGEHNAAIREATNVVNPASRQLESEINAIGRKNTELAGRLSVDGNFNSGLQGKDRAQVSAAVKAFTQATGTPGYVVVVDKQGKVFYSSDAPAQSGYEVRDIANDVDNLLLNSRVWSGPAALTCTGTFAIVGIVPVKSGGSTIGLVAVCQPINGEFLSGVQKKAEIIQGAKSLDLLLYSVKDGRVLAMTPELARHDGGFVTSLNHEGLKSVPKAPDFEKNGRVWRRFALQDAANKDMALVLVSAPMPDEKPRLAAIAGQAAISGFLALMVSFLFSIGISGRFNRSVTFLVDRAKALAAHKTNLPPLDGLTSEFMELAEVIDTAVTSPRSSVKGLQSQLGRHQEELAEKQKQVEAASAQVEAVNRQLMIQSKQLSEINKQINSANAQSILLQQKLNSVLAISTEGYLMLDMYGNVLSANPTFLKWFGVQTEGEVAGRFVFDLIRRPGENGGIGGNGQGLVFQHHGGNPQDLIAQFYPEGIVFNQREGKPTEVLAHLQPITTDDHSIQGYIMVLRDKSLHSEANRLRNEIIAMLQESIRAPLAMADQKWTPVLNTTSSQYSSTPLAPALLDLHANYQAVINVVDSLLMMHGGIMPPQPIQPKEQVSVTRLIGDCLEQVAQQARAHQIMLDYKTVTGLPSTALDKQILRDIIIQLLEKMISVTAPGGRVRVESSSKNNEIRLSIFSSGPALPQEEIEDMFAGFIQGKHPEDTYSSRLSLYLVRNNLERLGGKIWAESDRGTYFYLTVPIQ